MKKISVRSAAIALTFCLCTFIAASQTKPNLTGTWKMNSSKSKFVNNSPSEITIKFDQTNSSFTESLTITDYNGEHKADLKYTSDGKETTNQIDNRPVQTTAKWEGLPQHLVNFCNRSQIRILSEADRVQIQSDLGQAQQFLQEFLNDSPARTLSLVMG